MNYTVNMKVKYMKKVHPLHAWIEPYYYNLHSIPREEDLIGRVKDRSRLITFREFKELSHTQQNEVRIAQNYKRFFTEDFVPASIS